MITQDEQEAIKQYGLTMSEARIFCAIKESGFISYGDLFSLIISRSPRVVVSTTHDRRGHVMMNAIKRKTGREILNVRGRGYQLTTLNNS